MVISVSRRGLPWLQAALPALAAVFAAATVLYIYFWMVAAQTGQPPAVELGFDCPYNRSQPGCVVTNVKTASPAERAGLRVGDRIVAADGRRIANQEEQDRIWKLHVSGDSIRVTVLRPGEFAPLDLTGVFRRNQNPAANPGSSLQGAAHWFLLNSMPLAFGAVGLVILFLRPHDRNVWLLACFFAGIIAAPGFSGDFRNVPVLLRPWVEVYKGFFWGMIGPSFYFLCAVFPARSPIDRRLPWLKWVALVFGLALAGEMHYPDVLPPLGIFMKILGPRDDEPVTFGIELTLLILGLASLTGSFFFAGDPEARRKIRVIFWGTAAGLGPSLVRTGVEHYTGFMTPAWLDTLLIATLLLVPASFAYAVFKQRVLDIPVLLRRGARYVMVQRGFLLLLCFASFGLTVAFATVVHLNPWMDISQAANTTVGAVFGTALLWGGSRVHTRVSGRIDRAFFRSVYDGRVILENLAETSRTAVSREALAHLLLKQLNAALQPASLVVYLAVNDHELGAAAGDAPSELRNIPSSSPLLLKLARQGEPWELPPAGLEKDAATAVLAPLHSGCLVPILGRNGRLVGLLALGSRLSEEPYSGEDKRLLASVGSQAGMALDNFRLAEDIAEKLEAERRSAREMEIAKEVQNRLLPQSAPSLKTLDCAGRCLQAWRVGGDYYDFLELGREQLGLVLADVSGKGMHAALLMANLQAHLRTLSALASRAGERMTARDLVNTLQQVNHVVWKSTDAQHYATLFFGLYDDSEMRLAYVNCGHNPPILLRAGGGVDRLQSTATVIGLFEKWECEAVEVDLQPGDLLAIFSDGVTEAMRGEEEFGEPRFLDQLRDARRLPLEQVVTMVFAAVQEFSAGNQSDDLTLMVARAKSEPLTRQTQVP